MVDWIDPQPQLEAPVRRLAWSAAVLRVLAWMAAFELLAAVLAAPRPWERALRWMTLISLLLVYAAWALQRAALIVRLRARNKDPAERENA